MNSEARLITTLRERQLAAAETDLQFSVRLGVSRSRWNLARRGIYRLGPRLLRGVMLAYPDLAAEVLGVLLPPRDASIPTRPVRIDTKRKTPGSETTTS